MALSIEVSAGEVLASPFWASLFQHHRILLLYPDASPQTFLPTIEWGPTKVFPSGPALANAAPAHNHNIRCVVDFPAMSKMLM